MGSRLFRARPRMAALAAALLALPLLGAAPPAAITSGEDAERALATALRAAEAARERGEALERRARRIADRADRSREQAAALAARVQEAEAAIAAAEARVAVLAARRDALDRRLAARRAPIAGLLAQLQTHARRPPLLALVQPGSVREMVHARALLASMTPAIEAASAGLRADLAQSRRLAEQARQALAALRAGRGELGRRQAELAMAEKELRLAARETGGSARREAERAIGLAEQARDIDGLIDSFDAADRRREALAALPAPLPRLERASAGEAVAASPTASGGAPRYRLPVLGTVVAGLGERDRAGVRSRGLSIATRDAAQVVAPADGRIAYAGPYRGFGSIVIIDHDGPWTSLVANLDVATASVGDSVRQGAPIGRMPPRRATAIVELRRAGTPVDITRLIG